ncbi:MAG: hypothetical protein IPI81_17290 [Flavobacteriales bacterium]|nr:hypothetical protein [Flavobacteriales bacterium]MCC6938481.1 hypothetical protein [Flavobacteriales bacterium]
MATLHTIVPKEGIPSLRFPKEPVELSDETRKEIHLRMEQALRLGSAEHGKCRILFEDDEGLKAVETTIWAFDAQVIVLKYGLTIPVSRVVGIEFPS